MRFKIIFLILIFLILGTQVLCSEVDTVLSDVEKNMGNVHSIQGMFVQKKQMAMFDTPITILGKLYIENPDKFAWIVTEPIEYSLIISKNRVTKWDKSNGATSLSLKENPMFKEMVEQITFWFSGNYATCTNDYDINLVKTEPIILEFVPKEDNPASKMLTKITLVFQEDKKYLSKIFLLEKNEDITELVFNDVKINSDIDASVWETK